MSVRASSQLSLASSIVTHLEWSDEISFSANSIGFTTASKIPWIFQRIFTVFMRAIETLLSALTGTPTLLLDLREEQKALLATIDNLKEIFGARRVQRTIEWCGIDVDSLYYDGRKLSKHDLSTLFHALELITKDDIEELLEELNSGKLDVRKIDSETLLQLQQQFQNKRSISSCTPDDIRTLEKFLLPFKTSQDQFWNGPEDHINELSFPVTRFIMIESVAWTVHLLRHKNLSLKDWEPLVAKRLSQPQLPQELLLPHPENGYLCFSHCVEGGGASKRFFRSLHKEVSPLILYRGTRGPMPGDRFFDMFSSWLEDLRRELGASGPISTYEATKELLEKPELGFVENCDQQVALLTNSIGGSQAQRDAVLFHKRVQRLTTNSSPGVDKETADLFCEIMKQPRATPMVITHIIDKGDVVDTAGDAHIGGNCPHVSLTFRSLSPTDSESTENSSSQWTTTNRLYDFLISNFLSLPSNIIGIFRAHVRATTAGVYNEEVISTDDPTTRDIAIAYAQHQQPHFDPSWELARRYFCPAPSPGFAGFARQALAASQNSQVIG